MKLRKEVIEKIIEDNYIVLKSFDVVDGDITFKDFMKHIIKRKTQNE